MTNYPCHSLHLLWTALVYPGNFQAILTEHPLQDVSPYLQYTFNHMVNLKMCFQDSNAKQIKHAAPTFWQTLSPVQKADSELQVYLKCGTCIFQSA